MIEPKWYGASDQWWETNIKDQVYVVDDIIPLEDQEDLKELLMGDQCDFPWYYITDVTAFAADKDNQSRAAFVHTLVRKSDKPGGPSQKYSEYVDNFLDIIQAGCIKVNKPQARIIQGRTFIQLPSGIDRGEPDSPHIDLHLCEGDNHFVILYYVCDSDGDTIIYNEQDDIDKGYTMPGTYTIKERVSPKQGRAVIFDGRYYHTAEQPKHNTRCVINYNIR
tara:strand:+ start:479 stop:1141 length:663 start_codon:yes stop_codon:yes gene_type:complete